MKNKELGKLAAAFGPALIVLGLSKLTGTGADVWMSAFGAVFTSFSILRLGER